MRIGEGIDVKKSMGLHIAEKYQRDAIEKQFSNFNHQLILNELKKEGDITKVKLASFRDWFLDQKSGKNKPLVEDYAFMNVVRVLPQEQYDKDFRKHLTGYWVEGQSPLCDAKLSFFVDITDWERAGGKYNG